MVARLTRRSQQIADAPLSGRRVPEYDMDQIDVIAVLHGSRNVLGASKEED